MAQQESPAFKQLKDQLREMFQLDRGDLDFGIYRIMNQKRGEVTGPPPINESISGVNPDKIWIIYRRHINGKEALYG